MRFSPVPAPGAAPRFTAFAGLRDALELTTGVTFESAVPNGVGDTWRVFPFSPAVLTSADSEDDTEKVFDADCCNGIVAAVAIVVPFWGESSGGGDTIGVDDVEGSEAAIGEGALGASDGAD